MIQWHFVHSQCREVITSGSRTLSSPQKEAYTLSPQPPMTTTDLPVCLRICLRICLSFMFRINGFCIWLISLGIMFSRFTHVVVCVGASLLSTGSSIVWAFGLIPPF